MKRESIAIHPRACGIETELGVIAPGLGLDITAGGRFLEFFRAAFPGGERRIRWDPRERTGCGYDESADRRHHSYLNDPAWQEGLNFLLKNAARLYLDGTHAEISSPTGLDPRMVVVWNRAGYLFLDRIRTGLEAEGKKFLIFRNNVAIDPGSARKSAHPRDNARETWGSHLNITGSQSVPEEDFVRRALPWFTEQIVLSGAGKVGCDVAGAGVDFQISQRADFTEDEANGNTIAHRPIVCTRNFYLGAYADIRRFRRIHMIHLDSNMLELPEYLKIALNVIFNMALEDGFIDDRFEIYNPVSEIHKISWDLELRHRLWLTNQRKSRNIIDCLWDWCDLFWEYLEAYYPEEEELKAAVIWFSLILKKLAKKDWEGLWGWLDWVTNMLVIREAIGRKGKSWADYLAYDLDLRYHDNSMGGLFHEKIAGHPNVVRVTTDDEIERAISTPPPTRSRWIHEIIRRYGENVEASTYWNRISFRGVEGRPGFQVLILNDPGIVWNEALASQLLALPLPEFLDEIQHHAELSAEVMHSQRDLALRDERFDDDGGNGRCNPDAEDEEQTWLDMARNRMGHVIRSILPTTGEHKNTSLHRCSECRLVHDAQGRIRQDLPPASEKKR